MDNKKEIIIIREGIIGSIITDIVTFGTLLACMWCNFTFLGNSKIMQWFLGFFIIIKLTNAIAKRNNHVYSVDEAYKKIKAWKDEKK